MLFGLNKPSPARRAARIFIWTAFAAILFIRFGLMRDYYKEFHRKQQQQQQAQVSVARPQPFQRNPGRRQRRQSDVRRPISKVPTSIYRIEVEIAPKDVETLRQYHWNGWGGGQLQKRPKVKATVREGGVVYTNVSLNLKGSAGSFRSIDDKPALTLRFSKHEKHQRFHGYSKISLNNSVQDPTYLCEIISRELFEAAGVPVPRAEHATVIVNGVDKNLYVLTEGFNEQFLSRYFTDLRGNLYDGGFLQDIDSPLDTNSGDNPNDRSDLQELVRASNEPDPEKRWSELNRLLDMNRFITFMAMEVMTCHWDGYSMNQNNYRIFHDLKTERMIFIPHGMDQMFGTFRSSPQSDILPRFGRRSGMVAESVLAHPAGLKQYLDTVAELRATVFLEDKLTRRVRELADRIHPVLEAYGLDVAQRHDAEVAGLIERINERAKSITRQLAWYQEQLRAAMSGGDSAARQ